MNRDNPLSRNCPSPEEADIQDLEDSATPLGERARRVRVRQQIEDILIEQRMKREEKIV